MSLPILLTAASIWLGTGLAWADPQPPRRTESCPNCALVGRDSANAPLDPKTPLTELYRPTPRPTAQRSPAQVTLSGRERELARLINRERTQRKLNALPISAALTHVAKIKCEDMRQHRVFDRKGCNPHSWSDHGPWTPCCYPPDHSMKQCMYDKPGELTQGLVHPYDGYGFEIALISGTQDRGYPEPTPERAVLEWMNSTDHRNLVIHEGPWKQIRFEAMGVALCKGGNASVWFGREPDPDLL